MEERLKKFAHLVDVGSFTKAASELHLSQPALSMAIAKLERELKAPLFVRGSRPLAPTPAGKLAYQTAKDLSVQADNLRLRLAELAHEQVSLRVGMIDSVADALFADGNGFDMLDGAQVSIVVNNSRYLMDAVERGDLDAAFIVTPSRKSSNLLEVQSVGAEPLAVVCHPSRHATPSAHIPDLISYDQPSNTYRLVQRALASYGVTAQATIFSTSPEVMLRLALQNKGVAALPYLMVREHLQNGQLKRLGTKRSWLIQRQIAATKRRDRELPQAIVQLNNRAANVLHELMAEAGK
jgi:DNA-binding transcriptional LysR family regulator